MVFSSNTFLFFFLPICIISYYLVPNRWKNFWLLVMSLFFYSWGGVENFPIMCISIFVNYMGGYLIHKEYINKRNKLRKIVFIIIVFINLLLLGYWKYFNFFYGTFAQIIGISCEIPNIELPIGISFFTFQGLSYVIDVYQDKVPVQKKIVNVGLYIALFPQLIAGPIVRYSDINKEIEERFYSTDMFIEGIRRFSIGLAKKAILANTLGMNADAIFGMYYTQNTPFVSWIGAVSYTLQIYFDFSGYSDMAIGLGKMFGFHFTENFNYPYISKNVPEFWRRWHISLSSWLRDYIYIPLGGNRKGFGRTLLNTMIIFLVSGLWHGANWTFVFWGGYYGGLIVCSLLIERIKTRVNCKFKILQCGFYKFVCIIRTNLIVIIGWVFFKSNTIGEAFNYIKSMFGLVDVQYDGYTWRWYLTNYNIFILVIAIMASLPLGKRFVIWLENKLEEKYFDFLCNGATLILLLVAIMYVITSTYNPFIYFQF